MTTIITTLQLLIFVLYIGIVWYKWGVLDAISESTYKWEGERKWYFLLFLGSIGILNLLQGMGGWGVVTTAGLFFGGITVDYKDNIAGGWWVHSIGIISALVFSFIGLWVLHGLWWLFPLFLIGVLSIYTDTFVRDDTKLWWAESLGFLLIIFGYYIR